MEGTVVSPIVYDGFYTSHGGAEISQLAGFER